MSHFATWKELKENPSQTLWAGPHKVKRVGPEGHVSAEHVISLGESKGKKGCEKKTQKHWLRSRRKPAFLAWQRTLCLQLAVSGSRSAHAIATPGIRGSGVSPDLGDTFTQGAEVAHVMVCCDWIAWRLAFNGGQWLRRVIDHSLI